MRSAHLTRSSKRNRRGPRVPAQPHAARRGRLQRNELSHRTLTTGRIGQDYSHVSESDRDFRTNGTDQEIRPRVGLSRELDRTIGTSHRQGDGVAQRCDTRARRTILCGPVAERAGPFSPHQRGRLGRGLINTQPQPYRRKLDECRLVSCKNAAVVDHASSATVAGGTNMRHPRWIAFDVNNVVGGSL